MERAIKGAVQFFAPAETKSNILTAVGEFVSRLWASGPPDEPCKGCNDCEALGERCEDCTLFFMSAP